LYSQQMACTDCYVFIPFPLFSTVWFISVVLSIKIVIVLCSNVIMCIATLLTRWRNISGNRLKFQKYKIIRSWYFNRGIDTLKITALSNHKPRLRLLVNNVAIHIYKNKNKIRIRKLYFDSAHNKTVQHKL
jgi:hypothetical protein